MSKTPKNANDKTQPATRQERLKQALRANLRRRKQARPAPQSPQKTKPIKSEHG